MKHDSSYVPPLWIALVANAVLIVPATLIALGKWAWLSLTKRKIT